VILRVAPATALLGASRSVPRTNQGRNHAQARRVAFVNARESMVVGLTVVGIALCVVATAEMSVTLILLAVASTLGGIVRVASA
jgi:Mg2+/Co2+ transporter CorB